jgi:hypothetical protein
MVRTAVGVVAGVVCLGVVVTLLQQISSVMHPLPAGLDPMDPADAGAFADYVAAMPAGAWIVAMMSEVLGAAIGGLVAGTIARDARRGASGAVVGLATVGSVMNWTAFPHPVSFIVAQIVLYPVALMSVWALLSSRTGDAAAGAES